MEQSPANASVQASANANASIADAAGDPAAGPDDDSVEGTNQSQLTDESAAAVSGDAPATGSRPYGLRTERTRSAWGKLGTPSEALALSAQMVRDAEEEDLRLAAEAVRAAETASKRAAVDRLRAVEHRQRQQDAAMEDGLRVQVCRHLLLEVSPIDLVCPGQFEGVDVAGAARVEGAEEELEDGDEVDYEAQAVGDGEEQEIADGEEDVQGEDEAMDVDDEDVDVEGAGGVEPPRSSSPVLLHSSGRAASPSASQARAPNPHKPRSKVRYLQAMCDVEITFACPAH
jgi:hypothetical protein